MSNTLILFGGAHCSGCKRMSAMLDNADVKYKYYDVEEYPTKAQIYNVGGLPTIFILGADGKPKDSMVGMVDLHTIKRLLAVQ